MHKEYLHKLQHWTHYDELKCLLTSIGTCVQGLLVPDGLAGLSVDGCNPLGLLLHIYSKAIHSSMANERHGYGSDLIDACALGFINIDCTIYASAICMFVGKLHK